MVEEEGDYLIVVVDPDPLSRNHAEEAEDDFDRKVLSIAPEEFSIECCEEIVSASAFIVSWDLEYQSGADLLEEIRRDLSLSDRTVLVAAEAPTEQIVRLALRLGADGFCMKPYDAAEIELRLAAIEKEEMGQGIG